MPSLNKKIYKPNPLSIKEFYEKRNKVLIWHDKGGLGDAYMHRMVFEDFKNIMPEGEFVFACLPEYLDAMSDHPYIFEVIDSRTVDPSNYIAFYNTCVTVADRYENLRAPFCIDHRSDIWAKYCGVELKNHNMHIKLDPVIHNKVRENLKRFREKGKALIGFAPISKMITKTLLPHQLEAIIDATKDHVLLAYHKEESETLKKFGIKTISKISLKEFPCYLQEMDYIISVDTAAFHLAGGLKKPLMGIFTFADGEIYGKYFDFVLVQKHRNIKVQGKSNWDCGPCFKFGDCPKCKKPQKPCLTELTREELQEGVKNMFDKWPWEK
jgi:ADP-heptose:LPS heptosyltransferase